MKEYLEKQVDGSYELVMRGIVGRDGDIEVPEGATYYAIDSNLGIKKNYFFRCPNDAIWVDSQWMSASFSVAGQTVLWQRHIQPEELPFIDDEPKYTDDEVKYMDENGQGRSQSINDQYAEIEQVRQSGMKFDSNKPRHSLLPKGAVNSVIKVLEFGAKKYTVIDFYDRITIGRIIENRIWLSMTSVSSAEITKEFSPRVVVQNVIERSSIKYLHALAVKKRSLSQQKMEDVVLVTSLKELPNALWNLKLDKSISELTESHQILKKGSERESEIDAVILNTEKSKAEIHVSETSRGTDSLCRSMSVFVSEDALYAEALNVHTLTTTIVQGNSETYFAVSAIKLSDCYKTLLILLEHYYSISININEIGTVVQDADNWQKVDNAEERYYNAAMRHIDSWWNGEKCDPETGSHHLAHAATNLFFLMWFDNK